MKNLLKSSAGLAIIGLMSQPLSMNAQQAVVTPADVSISYDKVGSGGTGKIDPPPPVELSGSETPSLQQAISLYPNPCHESLNIKFEEGETSQEIVILDMKGTKAYQATVTAPLTTLDVSHLRSGIYILQTAGAAYRFYKS